MKTFVLFTIYLLLLISASRANAQGTSPRLTNEDVVKMVQAGESVDLIVSRIKKSETDFDTSPSALIGLPKRGIPNEILLAMLESDPLGSNIHPVRKKGKRLTAADFQQLQASVLTVWSEFGSGTGFIIDEAGLVLTSEHIIAPSEYLAVQFDKGRKIPAKLLASDSEADLAVLWVNLAAVPDASVARLWDSKPAEPSVVEGERVVTIGSPLHQRKLFTTGTASKVNKRSITSTINLDKIDSGAPLFNSLGEAVGITTFLHRDVSGSQVYGILPIERTFSVIEDARKRMRRTSAPAARFLPVDPTGPFPLDAITTVATARDFDITRYSFNVGEFDVLLMTPTVRYHLANTRTERRKEMDPFDGLPNWAEYASGYKPVLFIYAAPRSGEPKSEFNKMRLLCGDREVEPIHPAKIARFVTAQDVTFRGVYAYSPGAISADCGPVTLEIFSQGSPAKVRRRELDRKVIARVDEDFSPYYEKYGRPPLNLMEAQLSDKTRGRKRNKWWEFSKPPK